MVEAREAVREEQREEVRDRSESRRDTERALAGVILPGVGGVSSSDIGPRVVGEASLSVSPNVRTRCSM